MTKLQTGYVTPSGCKSPSVCKMKERATGQSLDLIPQT